MTGVAWIEESGQLHSPIALTNSNSVGVVRDALCAYQLRLPGNEAPSIASSWTGALPVAAETWDGWLNDIGAFAVKEEHLFRALDSATSGVVQEGNVGGGTGMVCHEFKGGIGTSSRVVETEVGTYVVGTLVQTNYGSRENLRVDGVPVGREIGFDRVPGLQEDQERPQKGGSIIVIIATDAPLLPIQCKRLGTYLVPLHFWRHPAHKTRPNKVYLTTLARRATIGLARVGGLGHNGSGDLFLAFSTGNTLPIHPTPVAPHQLRMVPNDNMNMLFDAVADSTEEAILNALTAAQDMVGFKGRTAKAIPIEVLREVLDKHRPRE